MCSICNCEVGVASSGTLESLLRLRARAPTLLACDALALAGGVSARLDCEYDSDGVH